MPPDIPDSTLDFARLRTPPAHGEVLVEPAAERWPELTLANHQRLAGADFRILDLSAGEVRRAVRQAAGLAAHDLAVVSGHEPEFVHPGVLAKHVMADRLAAAVQGQAINLVVDHDAPKRTAVDVPTITGGSLAVRAVCYADPPQVRAFELMPPLGAPRWAGFERDLRGTLGERFDGSLLPIFFAGAQGAAGASDWVDQWSAGRRAVEAELGVRITDLRVSRLWGGPLLADMMVHARRFAASYNAALAEHRRVHRVRSAMRPIPDLIVEDERVEVAAWVFRRNEARRRLFVAVRGDAMQLFADREPLGALDGRALKRWATAGAALAALEGVMFRPRALTLTLWARLFLADIFIHGIGGAKYDRITDAIIRDYCGVEPPAMTCVSATLLLDLPRHDLPPDALAVARRAWRDLRYNPQRHVSAAGSCADWLRRREEAVDRSRGLRAARSRDRDLRRRIFESIRAYNARILSLHPDVKDGMEQELRRTERMAAENRLAGRRNFFVGFYHRRTLETLLDRLPAAADLAR